MRIGRVSAGWRRTSGRTALGRRPLGRQVQRRRITGRSVFGIAQALQLPADRRRSGTTFVLNGFKTIRNTHTHVVNHQIAVSKQHVRLYVVVLRFSFPIILTVFVHARQHTFAESTSPTLIPVRFVHRTRAFRFRLANILSVASNRSLRGRVKITFLYTSFFFLFLLLHYY